jgi:AraC family transcriptional regulator of adaptative response / DNA-3-methyladenine glycosylase II
MTTRLADGRLRLDPGADRDEAERVLLAVPGIGPWTVSYVRMRALSDPDVFMPTDLGVRQGMARAGLPDDPVTAAAVARRWRPWRSYALMHLWALAASPRPARATDSSGLTTRGNGDTR